MIKLPTYQSGRAGNCVIARPDTVSSYQFFNGIKGTVRVESHPISRFVPDWFSYPHWHNKFIEGLVGMHHLPVVEPIIGAISVGVNATKSCWCQER